MIHTYLILVQIIYFLNLFYNYPSMITNQTDTNNITNSIAARTYIYIDICVHRLCRIWYSSNRKRNDIQGKRPLGEGAHALASLSCGLLMPTRRVSTSVSLCGAPPISVLWSTLPAPRGMFDVDSTCHRLTAPRVYGGSLST